MSNDEKLNLPTLAPLPQRHWWKVVHDWHVSTGDTIPAGFVADLDSIPHIPGLFALFKGRARASALLHDYHYATGKVSRKQADEIFYDQMLKENVPRFLARLMYRAVRMMGWHYFNKSQEHKPEYRLKRRMIDENGHAECFND